MNGTRNIPISINLSCNDSWKCRYSPPLHVCVYLNCKLANLVFNKVQSVAGNGKRILPPPAECDQQTTRRESVLETGAGRADLRLLRYQGIGAVDFRLFRVKLLSQVYSSSSKDELQLLVWVLSLLLSSPQLRLPR